MNKVINLCINCIEFQDEIKPNRNVTKKIMKPSLLVYKKILLFDYRACELLKEIFPPGFWCCPDPDPCFLESGSKTHVVSVQCLPN